MSWRRRFALWACAAVMLPRPAEAQDDGSRTYQLLAADTRLLTLFGVANRGNQADDPAIVTPGSVIDTRLAVFRYAQYFAAGQMAGSAFAILPTGKVSGTIGGKPGGTSSGIGDAQIGALLGLIGYPALSSDDYPAYQPGFSVSALVKLSAPTGAYYSTQQINLGANRWSLRIGPVISYSFGENFLDPGLTPSNCNPRSLFLPPTNTHSVRGGCSRRPSITSKLISRAISTGHGGCPPIPSISRGVPQAQMASATTITNRSLALGASLGTQVGDVYLKATYGHVVQRNDDGLYKKGFRLLAVYAF